MSSKEPLLLIALFAISVAAAGQSVRPAETDSERQLAARCAYTESDDTCKNFSSSRELTRDQVREVAQTQFPRRGPGFGPPRYSGPYGPPPYMYGSYADGHAVVGALIGFGAGFALGASANQNSGTRVGSGLIVGALGAVFGAAIGHGIATFPHHSFRRHRWSDEDDDDWASAKFSRRQLRESRASEN
jgi:hypothetical protein